MEISEKSQENNLDTSIASPADFLARTSATPGKWPESVKEQGVDCGLNICDSFAVLSRDLSSWKTSQVCLTGELEQFSGTWPRAGMMRNGIACQRLPLAPPTYEIEFSYLPTPDASLGGFSKGSASMDTTSWWNKENTGKRKSGASIGSSLRWCREFIREHLRTGGELNPEWIEALMGFPIGWSDLKEEAMPSSHKSPSGSDAE